MKRTFAEASARRLVARLIESSEKRHPVRGISFITDFTGRVSLSKTMRDFVYMVKKAGIPCQTFDTRSNPEIPKEDYEHILTPNEDFDFHKYSHIVELYRSILPDGLPERKARVVFHDSAAGILESMPFLDTDDNIIGMSDFNADYFKVALRRTKVFKVLYPLMPPSPERTPRNEVRRKYGMEEGDFVVFFNFDFGSYYRKNPTAAIRAFASALGDRPDAKLVFKTKGAKEHGDKVALLERLAAELGVADRFIHLSSYLPRRDVDGLTDACDVYLSLHKAEGFGIGMAEAMQLGHPVVATDWSANTEFCTRETSIPVPYRLVPIEPWEYPVCMKEWAEADVDAAAAALRRLYDEPDFRAGLGARAQAFMRDHFSLENFKRSVDAFLDT